ncbi:MAG: aspartate racemase [Roseivirga sp.]
MQHKLIGIVGGMGPQAGVALHEAIIRHTPVKKDQDHLSVVLMTYPGEITDRTAFLEGTTPVNPAIGILRVIEKQLALGVRVIGIPCNTSHAPEIFNKIRNSLRQRHPEVLLVHLPEEVERYISQKHSPGYRLGLMATNGTYHAEIYQQQLSRKGYDYVVPPLEFQEEVVHKLIYDPKIGIKAKSVDFTDEAVSLWHKALDFFRQAHVNSIILGCTELSLIHRQYPDDTLTFIDTTEVLALSLIREATRPLPVKEHGYQNP